MADLSEYVDKKVSVMIDGLKQRESYVGTLRRDIGDFIEITFDPPFLEKVDSVLIRKSQILSIWIYHEE